MAGPAAYADGRTREAGIDEGAQVGELLDDVAGVLGAAVTPLGRLAGGVNSGAVRVRVAGRADAVLKAEPRTHPGLLDETLRARRIVEHMRGRGYPTPAWLAVGATTTHVWHLADFVDAPPVAELTPSLVEQLTEIVELQAGQATEPYDHRAYAWRVATGREPVLAGLAGRSAAVSELVERLARAGAAPPPEPPEPPDMVHADLQPGNVLVRDGALVAVVDIGNAGSGTRATDLTTLLWHTFRDPLDEVRRQLWTRILALVGREGAAVLAATHVALQLEWSLGPGRHDPVAEVVGRGHRVLDELASLR